MEDAWVTDFHLATVCFKHLVPAELSIEMLGSCNFDTIHKILLAENVLT